METRILALAGAWLAAISLNAGAAQAAGPPAGPDDRAAFIIEPPPAPAGEVVARQWRDPLLTAMLHSEAAARLEQAVVVDNGWGRKRTLPAGTLLFAATKGPAPYFCPVGSAKGALMWGVYYSCLRDEAGTGAFTTVQTGQKIVGSTVLIGMLDNGTVDEFAFTKKEVPLPTPVRYTRLDGKDGPSVTVRLLWQVKPAKADKPAEFVVWTSTSMPGAPNYNADGPPQRVELDAGLTGRLAYAGANFAILGVGADGSLRYRVEGQFAPTPIPMRVRAPPLVITF